MHTTRSKFPVQTAYKENKLIWELTIKALLANAVDGIKSMRVCHSDSVPSGALLLPASAICKVNCKSRLILRRKVMF